MHLRRTRAKNGSYLKTSLARSRKTTWRIVDCTLGMQSITSRFGITPVSAAHFLPQNRLTFAFGFEWTAKRNWTGCKALTSNFGQILS